VKVGDKISNQRHGRLHRRRNAEPDKSFVMAAGSLTPAELARGSMPATWTENHDGLWVLTPATTGRPASCYVCAQTATDTGFIGWMVERPAQLRWLRFFFAQDRWPGIKRHCRVARTLLGLTAESAAQSADVVPDHW